MSTVGNKKLSQQLVEFLLVVPFMVIILGILTEYAYALNINLTIGQAIKTAASASYTVKDAVGVDHHLGTYSQIRPPTAVDTSRDIIIKNVENGFIQYLKDNNVPTTTENDITVRSITMPATVGSTTIFVASYTYVPAFTLPNVFFRVLPDKFNFSAAAAVPSAFLASNSAYSGGIATDDLNQIWASGASLANKTSFDAFRQGIIKDNTSGGRGDFRFLIPNPILASGDVRPSVLSQPLELVTWWGTIPQQVVDMATGLFYTWEWQSEPAICYMAGPPDADGNPTSIPYDCLHWYIQTSPAGNLLSGQTIFVHDSEIPDVNSLDNWNPTGATDLSPTSVNCPLKRMVTMTNSAGGSTGSFEPTIQNSGGSTYKIKTMGDRKMIFTSADNIGILGWTP